MLLIDDAGASEIYPIRMRKIYRQQNSVEALHSKFIKENSIMFSIVQCYCDKKNCLVSYYVIWSVNSHIYFEMELLQTVIFDYLHKAYHLRKNDGIENWIKVYSYEGLVA